MVGSEKGKDIEAVVANSIKMSTYCEAAVRTGKGSVSMPCLLALRCVAIALYKMRWM